MELKLHPSDQTQWVIVAKNGYINLFSMKYKRADSIKRFMAVFDPHLPAGKWQHWYKKGYRCIKVEVLITESKDSKIINPKNPKS